MSVFRPLCNILKIKMIPFGMQKTAFYAPKGGILEVKGGLLERNMPPSGIWKTAYRFGFSEIWSDTPSLPYAG